MATRATSQPAATPGDRPLAADLHRGSRRPSVAVVARFALLGLVCAAAFLFDLSFGNPPQALGLDASWMEVIGWGFLHHLQWGRDLIFTYGPFGFLNPSSAYVTGALPIYALGQIALAFALALVIGLLFRSARTRLLCSFALVYLCAFSRVSGDLSWALTLVFGTVFLFRCVRNYRRAAFLAALVVLGPLFAVIALIKFSILLLWIVCAAGLIALCAIERKIFFVLLALLILPASLLAAWLAGGQDAANLAAYVATGLDVAYGYGHTMGVRPPFLADAAAIAALGAFVGICAFAAWRQRATAAAVMALLHVAVVAVLFWLAFLTRADEFHWPNLFAGLSLLAFALWCNPYVTLSRTASTALAGLVVICVLPGFYFTRPAQIPSQAWGRIQASLRDLPRIEELRQQRESEWQSVAAAAQLPRIRQRVGTARVDMVTWHQGIVLANAMNYAPRPVFQSYTAYTPALARLNERYFLGAAAPQFVLFSLDYIDGRFPASEDGLALLAILKRYRPVLVEKGFVLLQREENASPAAAVVAVGGGSSAVLGDDVALAAGGAPTIAFIRVELNAFGKIYTMLFREPALFLDGLTGDGERLHSRLVRLSAGSGFLINPLVRSSQDWIRLYLSKQLAELRSIRIDTETAWERALFDNSYSVQFQSAGGILHADPTQDMAELAPTLYPQFNIAPEWPTSLRIVDEGGRQAVFLHAPNSITFKPAPGAYSIRAIFGLQEAAVTDPGCLQAGPDGIGVSLIVKNGSTESVVQHADIDPYRVERERGPQQLYVENVDIRAEDTLVYRVDVGHGGHNSSCDWSYVRDFVAVRHGDVGWGATHHAVLFASGFE